MKKLMITLLALSMMAAYPSKGQVNQKAEKKAIITVIENEKEAFFEGNLENIDGTWKQDTASRKIYSGPNGFWEIKGWTALHNENKENLKEGRDDVSGMNLDFTNYDIVLYDNTALVYHDATWKGSYEGNEVYGMQKRILHMVKLDGKWKIDLMFMYTMPEKTEDTSNE